MLTHAKQVAELSGGPVEYLLTGAGDPTVVLLNGGDGPIEGWYKILPKLAEATQVLAYNRAGIGRTGKAASPQTSPLIIAQLRWLLQHSGLQPPFLLVGHSLGGLHSNYFARAFPEEVCGLVFLEATAPADVNLMARHAGGWQRRLQGAADWLFDRNGFSESRNAAASAEAVEQAGPFPDVPLAVISGTPGRGMPQAARAGRLENQRALSRLTSTGRHIMAQHSGHFPQFSEPELVVSAILAALREVRQQRSRASSG
jgi:pimeloyl-ACP methyl ester carboxylesterase